MIEDPYCSECYERLGAQHKPSCHRQGLVTGASDYRPEPPADILERDRARRGFEVEDAIAESVIVAVQRAWWHGTVGAFISGSSDVLARARENYLNDAVFHAICSVAIEDIRRQLDDVRMGLPPAQRSER